MTLTIPTSPFERVASRYIRLQHALGKRFAHQQWVIGQLARFLAGRAATDVDAALFEAWCQVRRSTSPTNRRAEALIIRRLCLYRQRTEPGCFVPDPLYFPRRTPTIAPVIIGSDEIRRILQTIDAWPAHPQLPLRKAALRISVILLYTAGLRRGELTKLTLADVDLRSHVLRIRESKFHKSRFVPLSPSATRELRHYLKARLAAPWDISADAPLLGHQHGSVQFRGYVPEAISQSIRQIFQAAKIHDPHGRHPRLHDLRHSFAVQALLRWYRTGVDVQAKLPQLSMYMGHVSIASTAYYLHFIPAIAAAAHRRFERHFGPIARGGVR